MSELGPCVICGATGYSLSFGGPSICPKCDCGHFDAATVEQQAKVIASLRSELAAARKALEEIAAIEDQEFGGDWDEIEQARQIARAALSSKEPEGER